MVAEMSPIEHRFCTIIRRTCAELLACGKESHGVGFCLDVSWERFRRGRGGRKGGREGIVVVGSRARPRAPG